MEQSPPTSQEITRMLQEWSGGKQEALYQLGNGMRKTDHAEITSQKSF